MSEDNKEHDYPVSLDEKLVAYLLGEADAEVAAEVEAALDADPALRTRREELQAALGLLRTPQFAPGLDAARREELRAAAAGAAPESVQEATGGGTLHRFPMMRAAAALVIFGGLVTIWQKPWEAAMSPGEEASLDSGLSSSLAFVGSESDEVDSGGFRKQPSAGGAPSEERVLETLGLGREQAPASSQELSTDPQSESNGQSDVRGWNADVGGFAGGGTVEGLAQRTQPEATTGLALIVPPPSVALGSSVSPGTPAPRDTLTSTLGYVGSGGGELGRYGRRESLNLDKGIRFEQESLVTVDFEIAEWGDPSSVLDVGNQAGEKFLFDRSVDGDVRARTRNLFGIYGEDVDLEDDIAVRRLVIDGYGYTYYEDDLIEHLRPRCRQCREIENHRGRCEHHESPQAMFFRFYGDNPVTLSANENFSTFAADVDTASYPLTRNYLVNGSLPPKTAIRTEEFVNYFKLGLAPPTEGDFAVHLDAMPSLFSDDQPRMLLRAGIQARVVSREERKSLNLVFVIDKSGSMAQQNRLELVKRSLELLVDQLRDDDTVGIVTFDSTGHSVLAPTAGHLRWEIREAIRGLGTGGSTNAGAGLEIGFAMAEKAFRADAVNRVILASDGVANTGETDQQAILDKVRAHAEAHIDLTTIGVGMGNHNDVFLEQLADKGDGSCHYVDDFSEAKRVLVDGFTGVMQTVARDVKIQLEFDGEVVEGWRQLGYENRSLTKEQFRDDSVDAGEIGAGHSVAALYELDLAQGAGGDAKLVTLRLRWFPDGSDEAVEEVHTLKIGDARGKWGLSEPRLRLSAVAAQYAEVLRRSYHARSDSYDVLKSESEALARELSDDASVAELRDMIARTESMARLQPLSDPLAQLVEQSRIKRLQEAELARMEQDAQTSQLLEEIRAQNDRIEAQIRELTKPR